MPRYVVCFEFHPRVSREFRDDFFKIVEGMTNSELLETAYLIDFDGNARSLIDKILRELTLNNPDDIKIVIYETNPNNNRFSYRHAE